MSDYARPWYKDWVRDRTPGCQDQISGKNPHTPHYGENIATGIELPKTDRHQFTYQDRVLADAQIMGKIKPVGDSVGERPASEQAIRLECLKIAAQMNSGFFTTNSLTSVAESLLKWVRTY